MEKPPLINKKGRNKAEEQLQQILETFNLV